MRHAREREREVSAYRPPYRAERSRNTQSWWLGVGFSAPGVARERCVFVGRLVFRLHSIKENLLQAHVPCTPILRAVWVSRRILGEDGVAPGTRLPAPGAAAGRCWWWWGGGGVVWWWGVGCGRCGVLVCGRLVGVVGWWLVRRGVWGGGRLVGWWERGRWWGGGVVGGHVVCEASTRRRAPSSQKHFSGGHGLLHSVSHNTNIRTCRVGCCALFRN